MAPLAALPTSAPELLELPALVIGALLDEREEVIGALEATELTDEPVVAYTSVKGAVAAAGMLSV